MRSGIKYVLNPRLVRGLDYYSHTVFEWVTTELGSQGAVCSGGRYDGLVAQLGGEPTPAIGWALGEERIVELLRVQDGETPARRAGRVLRDRRRSAPRPRGWRSPNACAMQCRACASRRTAAAAASSRS